MRSESLETGSIPCRVQLIEYKQEISRLEMLPYGATKGSIVAEKGFLFYTTIHLIKTLVSVRVAFCHATARS